jgi:hypothetical protein
MDSPPRPDSVKISLVISMELLRKVDELVANDELEYY